MIKAIIIEDEPQAISALKLELELNCPDVIVKGTAQSVKEGICKINKINPDLIFLDIQLSDGLGLDILEYFKEINFKIIITTAYSEYALQAIKFSALDYLLKPIDEDELKDAINKYKTSKQTTPLPEQFKQLLQLISAEKKSYKNTYLVHHRDTIIPLKVNDVAYFYIEASLVKAITNDNKSYIIDKKLEDIVNELNPEVFFRVNRQYIVHKNAIENLQFYFNGKLILNLIPKAKEQVIVSKAKAPQFKSWMQNQKNELN